MKKQITIKRLFDFINASEAFLRRSGEAKTKLVEAVKSVRKQVLRDKLFEEHQDKVAAIQLQHASVDEAGNVLFDQRGGYKFTREAMQKVSAELKTLSETMVEVQPVLIVSELENLTDFETLSFEGIVIPQ